MPSYPSVWRNGLLTPLGLIQITGANFGEIFQSTSSRCQAVLDDPMTCEVLQRPCLQNNPHTILEPFVHSALLKDSYACASQQNNCIGSISNQNMEARREWNLVRSAPDFLEVERVMEEH
ncbi:uncharacterized protein RHO17_011711 [Thomomys bottae]